MRLTKFRSSIFFAGRAVFGDEVGDSLGCKKAGSALNLVLFRFEGGDTLSYENKRYRKVSTNKYQPCHFEPTQSSSCL